MAVTARKIKRTKHINTWLYDTPIGYQTGVGYPVRLTMAYEQRETREISDGIFNFGEMWNCSWLSYIDWTDDDFGIRPKVHHDKVVMARRLRQETTMSLKWIAERLQM